MSWIDGLARRPLWLVMALAITLGLAFLGSRGLWEPDEGRYANVSLQMIKTGDYISLRRNDQALHFTKPPVTYWAMAASIQLLGRNEWAVRLPIALSYLLTVALVFQLGKRFVPTRPWLPALIYATCPATALAAGTVNTDSTLTMALTLAMLCFVQARFGGGSARWLDLMWAAFGLAFLTKGPPALLPLLVIVVFELVQRQGLRRLVRPLGWLAFAVIGLAWYAEVCRRHPGLLDYFLGHEVYARIATESLNRFPEWYGPLVTYLPTLTLGALPWFAIAARRLPSLRRPWAQMPEDLRLLWLWFGLPLLVLCISRSRLPLYVLPLFAPLSILLARAMPDFALTRRHVLLLAGWVGLIVAIKGYAAYGINNDKDSREFAAKLAPLLPGQPGVLLFVDHPSRNGLSLYLDTQVERLSFLPKAQKMSDSSFDDTLANELHDPARGRVFIMKHDKEPRFLAEARAAGQRPVRLGEFNDPKARPERIRVVYTLAGDFPQTGETLK